MYLIPFLGWLVSDEELPVPSLLNASSCAQRSALVQKEDYNWKSVYNVSIFVVRIYLISAKGFCT